METKKQYNYCLDCFKGIACIFVVFMHCEFPGLFGTAIQAVGRFCVPFFFMVSGYYCFGPIAQQLGIETRMQIIERKVLHIIKITFFASVFYLMFLFLRQLLLHNSSFIVTWKQLLVWIVFNEPRVIAGQYWFLFALLYTYLFYGLLERFNLRKIEYPLAAVLFVGYICLAQGAHLAGFSIPSMFYRNWLIEAFPFFMLGHWICENRERISFSNKTLLFLIALSSVLCLVERWLMGRDFGVNIVTIPQVFALFVYGVKNPKRHEGIMQKLGRDCSMLVYIFHPAVWQSIDWIYRKIGFSGILPALYVKPLIVLGFSILFSILFNLFIATANTKRGLSNAA